MQPAIVLPLPYLSVISDHYVTSSYDIMTVSPPVHRYPEFAPMFRAEMFDPDEWADLFKKAGAKCESQKLIVW